MFFANWILRTYLVQQCSIIEFWLKKIKDWIEIDETDRHNWELLLNKEV